MFGVVITKLDWTQVEASMNGSLHTDSAPGDDNVVESVSSVDDGQKKTPADPPDLEQADYLLYMLRDFLPIDRVSDQVPAATMLNIAATIEAALVHMVEAGRLEGDLESMRQRAKAMSDLVEEVAKYELSGANPEDDPEVRAFYELDKNTMGSATTENTMGSATTGVLMGAAGNAGLGSLLLHTLLHLSGNADFSGSSAVTVPIITYAMIQLTRIYQVSHKMTFKHTADRTMVAFTILSLMAAFYFKNVYWRIDFGRIDYHKMVDYLATSATDLEWKQTYFVVERMENLWEADFTALGLKDSVAIMKRFKHDLKHEWIGMKKADGNYKFTDWYEGDDSAAMKYIDDNRSDYYSVDDRVNFMIEYRNWHNNWHSHGAWSGIFGLSDDPQARLRSALGCAALMFVVLHCVLVEMALWRLQKAGDDTATLGQMEIPTSSPEYLPRLLSNDIEAMLKPKLDGTPNARKADAWKGQVWSAVPNPNPGWLPARFDARYGAIASVVKNANGGAWQVPQNWTKHRLYEKLADEVDNLVRERLKYREDAGDYIAGRFAERFKYQFGVLYGWMLEIKNDLLWHVQNYELDEVPGRDARAAARGRAARDAVDPIPAERARRSHTSPARASPQPRRFNESYYRRVVARTHPSVVDEVFAMKGIQTLSFTSG